MPSLLRRSLLRASSEPPRRRATQGSPKTPRNALTRTRTARRSRPGGRRSRRRTRTPPCPPRRRPSPGSEWHTGHTVGVGDQLPDEDWIVGDVAPVPPGLATAIVDPQRFDGVRPWMVAAGFVPAVEVRRAEKVLYVAGAGPLAAKCPINPRGTTRGPGRRCRGPGTRRRVPHPCRRGASSRRYLRQAHGRSRPGRAGRAHRRRRGWVR